MNRKTTIKMRLEYMVLQVNQILKLLIISKYFIDILNCNILVSDFKIF